MTAALVPAGAAMAHASAIPMQSIQMTYNAGTDVTHQFVFDSGAFTFALEFDHLYTSADIIVSDTTVLTHTLPPGYVCIPIATTSCIQFSVSETDLNGHPITLTSPTDFDDYNIFIDWTYDTDPQYPNSPGNRVRILHFKNDGTEEDGTIPGTYTAPGQPPTSGCGPGGVYQRVLPPEQYERICGDDDGDDYHHHHGDDDPGVMDNGDGFSDFIVAEAPASVVPEPGTMVLLATGLGALIGRRARRTDSSRRS